MACTPAKLEYQTAKNLFLAGRNMWREDAVIKKIVMHQRFVDLAFSTLHAPRLRLAYDEYIRTGARAGQSSTMHIVCKASAAFSRLCAAFSSSSALQKRRSRFRKKKGASSSSKAPPCFLGTPSSKHRISATF